MLPAIPKEWQSPMSRKPKSEFAATTDIEIFEQAPELPDLVWAEVNVLALPFAVLNEKEAKQSQGHDIKKVDVRDGKAVTWQWRVWPQPGVGMPTMFTLRVLFLLMQLASEAKQKFGDVPQKLDIGSLTGLCRRLALPEDGYNRNLIKAHIKILVSTQCLSQGAFKDKKRQGQFLDSFKYLRAAGFVGEKKGADTVETNYVVFDEPVWMNLNTQYIKQIDLGYMRKLRSPIAQLLYTKLSHLFHESRAGEIRVEYSWLAERMGLKIYSHLWEAKKQLKQAFGELVETHYIEEPRWDGWSVLLSPAVRYTVGEQVAREERKAAARRFKRFGQSVQLELPISKERDKEPIDPWVPLCTVYAASGWSAVERVATAKGIVEADLREQTVRRGFLQA
jgi:hypothetical protein